MELKIIFAIRGSNWYERKKKSHVSASKGNFTAQYIEYLSWFIPRRRNFSSFYTHSTIYKYVLRLTCTSKCTSISSTPQFIFNFSFIFTRINWDILFIFQSKIMSSDDFWSEIQEFSTWISLASFRHIQLHFDVFRVIWGNPAAFKKFRFIQK